VRCSRRVRAAPRGRPAERVARVRGDSRRAAGPAPDPGGPNASVVSAPAPRGRSAPRVARARDSGQAARPAPERPAAPEERHCGLVPPEWVPRTTPSPRPAGLGQAVPEWCSADPGRSAPRTPGPVVQSPVRPRCGTSWSAAVFRARTESSTRCRPAILRHATETALAERLRCRRHRPVRMSTLRRGWAATRPALARWRVPPVAIQPSPGRARRRRGHGARRAANLGWTPVSSPHADNLGSSRSYRRPASSE
jgi:hypothetical protein